MPPARRQAGWTAIGAAGRVAAFPVLGRAKPGEWAAPNPTVPDPASLVPTVLRELSVSSCHQHLSPEQAGTARADGRNRTHRAPVHGLLLDIVTPHPRQSSRCPGPDTSGRRRAGPRPAATGEGPSPPIRPHPRHLPAPHTNAPSRPMPDVNQNDRTAGTVRSPAPSRPSGLRDLLEVRLIWKLDLR